MDAVQLVAEVTSLVLPKASERGLRVLSKYQFPLPVQIDFDVLRLRQILINLCTHAIRCTNQDNVVLLTRYDVNTGQLEFCIRDRTDIALTKQQLGIFDPFIQAELLGAELIYEKVSDDGGEYVLTLPTGDTRDKFMIDDAEQLAKHQHISPLPSALANEGPEFDKIIDQFVRNLPELLAAIEEAYLAGEHRKVFEQVHNLKGMGGGFGFPQLTELAVEIESLSESGNYQAIAPVISTLYQLAHRICVARMS